MVKEIILKTDIKPDYSKYVYFCGVDESTKCLNIVKAERSARSKGIKEDMDIEKEIDVSLD